MNNLYNLEFALSGKEIPADHNYRLYASLIHHNQKLRNLNWQLGTITGLKNNQGVIYLSDKSKLRIRCDREIIPEFCSLDKIDFKISSAIVSPPLATIVKPHQILKSRIVTIKGFEDTASFAYALINQSKSLGISANYVIVNRKSIRIRQFTIIGFEVIAYCDSDADSLQLQYVGLGGKRKIGCGVFYEPN